MKKILGSLSVSIGLFVALTLFSLVVTWLQIGWNLFTVLLFWFLLAPAIAIHLPKYISIIQDCRFSSIAGLTLFYLVVVFMIYLHFQSDFFKLMLTSMAFNLFIVYIYFKPEESEAQVQ